MVYLLSANFKSMLKRLITAWLICLSASAFGQSAAAKYIQAHKDAAIQLMKEYDIPASIILGIAIHESASGTSKIARYLNNHFGIKGPNNSKEIKSAYKGYESVSESYEDFISLLQNRSSFSQLFDKYTSADYKSWVKGIQRGGYAASQLWGSQVLAIIHKYSLHELDRASDAVEAAAKEAVISYTVKKGDTLSEIARRHDTTVEEIKEKNNLKSSMLHPGQELIM